MREVCEAARRHRGLEITSKGQGPWAANRRWTREAPWIHWTELRLSINGEEADRRNRTTLSAPQYMSPKLEFRLY